MGKLPKYLTFDVYGTQLTWTLEPATKKILGERINAIDWKAFIEEQHVARWNDILISYRPYKTMMRRCFGNMARKYNNPYTEDDVRQMIAAIPTWETFPGVPPVLRKLREYSKICIISSTQDHFIEKNIENIGVPFDNYVSAQQARAAARVRSDSGRKVLLSKLKGAKHDCS